MAETIERAGNKVSSLNRYVICDIPSASTTHQNYRYNSFKVAALFSLGWVDAAAELGFSVYESRDTHPKWEIVAPFLSLMTQVVTSARHVRYGLFYHSLALVACIRKNLSVETNHYKQQIERNQIYLRKSVIAVLHFSSRLIDVRWFSPSPINAGTWITLIVRVLWNLAWVQPASIII